VKGGTDEVLEVSLEQQLLPSQGIADFGLAAAAAHGRPTWSRRSRTPCRGGPATNRTLDLAQKVVSTEFPDLRQVEASSLAAAWWAVSCWCARSITIESTPGSIGRVLRAKCTIALMHEESGCLNGWPHSPRQYGNDKGSSAFAKRISPSSPAARGACAHTLEQSKPTLRLDKLLDVLEVLGLGLSVAPGRGEIGPPVATTRPRPEDPVAAHAPGALPPFFSGPLPEGHRLAALRGGR